MRRLGWAWNPDPETTEALKRGRIKVRQFALRYEQSYLVDLTYRQAHPRPTRDELDLIRADSDYG